MVQDQRRFKKAGDIQRWLKTPSINPWLQTMVKLVMMLVKPWRSASASLKIDGWTGSFRQRPGECTRIDYWGRVLRTNTLARSLNSPRDFRVWPQVRDLGPSTALPGCLVQSWMSFQSSSAAETQYRMKFHAKETLVSEGIFPNLLMQALALFRVHRSRAYFQPQSGSIEIPLKYPKDHCLILVQPHIPKSMSWIVLFSNPCRWTIQKNRAFGYLH